MKTMLLGTTCSILALAMLGSGPKQSGGHQESANCGASGVAVTINGKTVCVPAATNDLRRFSTAASLAAFLNRPYADVVNDLVHLADPSGGGRLRKQPVPGQVKLASPAQIAACDLAAPAGQVISRLILKNQGQQPTRVLIDCGRAHLDLVLAPAQVVDTGGLLGKDRASIASILIAGAGAKLIAGTAQAVKAGGANDCVLFEKTFDCNFCSGSRCRRGEGGEASTGDCVPKDKARCLLIFEEPISCECK